MHASAGDDEPVWASDTERSTWLSPAWVEPSWAATLSDRGSGVAVVSRTDIAPAVPYVGAGADVPRYDVSRADGRLLAIRSLLTPSTDTPPVVVLNWFEEPRERVGN
jgi:hypothetical protein